MARFNLIVLKLCVLISIGACKPVPETGSSLMVIDGGPVTNPEQAPGTYGIRSYSNGKPVGHASAVAVSNNTLLTSGHVVASDPRMKIDRMDVTDYNGNVIHTFNPNDQGVKQLVNPAFSNDGRSTGDIGAYVFQQPIADNKLTHGTVSIGDSRSSVNQNVHLVGNGIQDYRALDDTNPESRTPARDSGTLRWGTNQIAQTDDYGFYINGVAFDTPDTSDVSVSGPGDSGGGVFATSDKGQKQFIGLMQSGGIYDPSQSDPQQRYFNSDSSPGEIANQPNSAYSYVVDVTRQDPFLEQVVQHGGSVSGRDYSNSNATPNSEYIYHQPEILTEPPPP